METRMLTSFTYVAVQLPSQRQRKHHHIQESLFCKSKRFLKIQHTVKLSKIWHVMCMYTRMKKSGRLDRRLASFPVRKISRVIFFFKCLHNRNFTQ